jgi:uncharacterized phiE125 gp8 family phage protein
VGLATVTPPASDPLSLAEARAHLRITSTAEDGLLAGYILAAREFVENATHRKLITQTLDYTLDDGWPCVIARGYYRSRIELPVQPVASVSSITYVDSGGSSQTLAADQYVVRTDGPVPFIEPAYGVSWPSVRCQSAAITVRFIAGTDVAEVPNPLMQAMRLLVAHANENREAIASSGVFTEVPLGVEAFLSPYRYTRMA